MPRRLVIFHRFDRGAGPRSRRAAFLAEALGERWLVERLTGTAGEIAVPGPPYNPNRVVRRLHDVLRRLRQGFLVDKFELWSRRYFRCWSPAADAVLLIGMPASPLLEASRRLTRLRIPYVVDLGDPIVISPFPAARSSLRGLGRWRALRAEHRMWGSAAGGIVTSESLAATLAARFPGLPILVRPNGYEQQPCPAAISLERDRRVLWLAHFGSIYGVNVDARPLLATLVRCGIWDEIRLDQYGWVSHGTDLAVEGVRIDCNDERPWDEVVALAGRYDAALALANRHLFGPLSKVFAYMTLPIPRIVLAADVEQDETARYVRRLSAWLAVESGDSAVAEKVRTHVARPWTDEELAPPASESWSAVAGTIGDFLERVLAARK